MNSEGEAEDDDDLDGLHFCSWAYPRGRANATPALAPAPAAAATTTTLATQMPTQRAPSLLLGAAAPAQAPLLLSQQLGAEDEQPTTQPVRAKRACGRPAGGAARCPGARVRVLRVLGVRCQPGARLPCLCTHC